MARTSLRILVMGDLTGRASRGEFDPGSLASRPLVAVDVDNFDSVLAQRRPEVNLLLAATRARVESKFDSLDDFHPDALLDRLDIFGSLRASKRRLLDPAQFAEEAARLRPESPGLKPPSRATPPVSAPVDISGTDLLSQ